MTANDFKRYKAQKTEIHVMRAMMEDVTDPERYRLYKEKVDAYDALGIRLEQAMQTLSADERTIMRLYYLGSEDHTWEWIAIKMHFSMQHIYRLRKSALLKLQEDNTNEKNPDIIQENL